MFTAYVHAHVTYWATLQTTLGELTAFPRPIAGFKGPTSKGREGRGGKGRRWERRRGEMI